MKWILYHRQHISLHGWFGIGVTLVCNATPLVLVTKFTLMIGFTHGNHIHLFTKLETVVCNPVKYTVLSGCKDGVGPYPINVKLIPPVALELETKSELTQVHILWLRPLENSLPSVLLRTVWSSSFPLSKLSLWSTMDLFSEGLVHKKVI